MKSILISVLGDDKPGLLDSLSEIIVSNDGDWIESNMSTVEAKFAGILRVNVPAKNAKKLIKELTSSKLGLQIACEETAPVKFSDFKSYNIELPKVSHQFSRGDNISVIESVKSASDLVAPVSGEIVEVNDRLEDDPELVSDNPMDEGWLIKVKLSKASELDELMDEKSYQVFIED